MNKDNIVIREIGPNDNAGIEQVIRACFHEFNIPLEGTAYTDPETKQIFQAYQNTNDVYFVIEADGEILGGGGLKPLSGFETTVCEIQKMYFSSKIRGKGYGKLLFSKCLEAAESLGYKQCYIESSTQLKAAIHIYETHGFKHLDKALGDTGHFSCGVWMLKDL